MELLEAMRVRRSVRTYLQKDIPQDLLESLVKSFNTNERLSDLRVTLKPMRSETVAKAMTGLVGSYGSIKNAPLWAIGISQNGKHYQENFGFRMEQFILECTRAGLGTCWVGGFFKKSVLDQFVTKEKNEHIVCVSPVGYAADRRLSERSMRSLGGLNARKPLKERVFHGQWGNPATEYLSSRKELLNVFELARWAPSASNLQPCHYVVDDKRILLTVLTSLYRAYPKFITRDTGMSTNFQPVDAGIAMSHILLAARELGKAGGWTLDFDEPALRSQYRLPTDAKPVAVFSLK
jgi:Nitroreductase